MNWLDKQTFTYIVAISGVVVNFQVPERSSPTIGRVATAHARGRAGGVTPPAMGVISTPL